MKAFRLCLVVLVSALCSGLAAPVQAHHSVSAEFNAYKSVTKTGVITKVTWINPHSWVDVDVKAPSGSIEKWQFQIPSSFKRQGASKGYFVVGQTLQATAMPAKSGALKGYVTEFKFQDGRVMNLRGQL